MYDSETDNNPEVCLMYLQRFRNQCRQVKKVCHSTYLIWQSSIEFDLKYEA